VSSRHIHEWRYVYCIVSSGERRDFGQIGIDNSLVYTLSVRDIGAVVHRCEYKSCKTDDSQKAAERFSAHQRVVEAAAKRFGVVIPQTFNTIISGDDEAVKNWLSKSYYQLKKLFGRLEGKEQCEIQVFVDNGLVGEIMQETKSIQRPDGNEGGSLLFRKQREGKLLVIEGEAKVFYDRIKELVDEARFQPVSREVPADWQDRLMILNLSCLIRKGSIQKLKRMIAEVEGKEGFHVRFTGPSPPYSFVDQIRGKRPKQRRRSLGEF